MVRFTTGYLHYRKFGPFFEEALRFPDGRKHKFCHGLCAFEQGVKVDELNMEKCLLDGCGNQFFCSRDPTECCLLVEQGYFQAAKGGLFVRFVPEQRGVVHWACARVEWQQKLLTPELTTGELFYADPP